MNGRLDEWMNGWMPGSHPIIQPSNLTILTGTSPKEETP
jgi:hypothetical protein